VVIELKHSGSVAMQTSQVISETNIYRHWIAVLTTAKHATAGTLKTRLRIIATSHAAARTQQHRNPWRT